MAHNLLIYTILVKFKGMAWQQVGITTRHLRYRKVGTVMQLGTYQIQGKEKVCEFVSKMIVQKVLTKQVRQVPRYKKQFKTQVPVQNWTKRAISSVDMWERASQNQLKTTPNLPDKKSSLLLRYGTYNKIAMYLLVKVTGRLTM